MGLSQSNWLYEITDYQGNSLGPVLGATSRTFSHPLNGMRTASFSIDLDNPAATYILNPPHVGGMLSYPLLKVYRKNRLGTTQLLMVGDIASLKLANRSTEGLSQLSVVAADGLWRLGKRLVGMGHDSHGRGQGYTFGSASSQVPLSSIINDVLGSTNSATGATGILQGSVPTAGVARGAIDPPIFQQNVAQLIAQISGMLGGPDLEITPMEPSTSGTYPIAKIGTLNQFNPLGSHKQIHFGFAVGNKNVASYQLDWDRTGHINKAWSLPQGFPSAVASGDSVLFYQDTANSANFGVWEDAIASDVSSISLRQILCQEYVTIRKLPRQQITFTPVQNCNLDYGADYLPGDVVGASAVDQNIIVYDGFVRVYGVNFTIDDQENEQANLTLIPSS